MSLIGKYLPVLDGFVGLVDYMGTDADIERAARTSYGKDEVEPKETGRLINYLTRHRHDTPSEMVIAKFHIACPIYVLRQMIRHRLLSVNEYSGRYAECPDKFHLPDFRGQSKDNKQGSSSEKLDVDSKEVKEHYENSYRLYQKLLKQGVSKELARVVLPLSLYTYFYVECDLRGWFHFIGLRSDSHAQKEIQVYSDAIGQFLKQLFPKSFQAFLDYKFNSKTFTAKEIDFLVKCSNPSFMSPLSNMAKESLKWENESLNIWSTDREIDDFLKAINSQPNDDRFNLNFESLKDAKYFKNDN